MTDELGARQQPFALEEATIAALHAALQAGQTTCVEMVQRYIDRVRAYNGVAGVLVTADGAPIPAATGAVRAQAALRFPTHTLKASTLLPDLDTYTGPPLEYGRMEATASDPGVPQQFGMIAGMPHVGQVNALATLNLRGERSVTCRGDFDKHPSQGPLPPGAPPVCEMFRQLPDALERAAELDATYGRHPDLEKMPMYGVVFSFKDSFDTQDMRSTGGGDARYDIDFPARDHLLVEQLRTKGAIIFAKAVNTEYNGRAGDPGGRHQPEKVLPSTLGYQRSTWGGNPSNPYDTTRAASLGSSAGSAVSVSINLVMASLGEETRASCRGPSNHNAVALILPHKSMLGFTGGAPQYGMQSNLRPESFNGPNAGLTEVLIPAGYVTTVYDPVFALSAAGTHYVLVASATPTPIAEPGLPFSLMFRAEPGKEDVLLQIAAAYEAASKRRVPPPAFGPLPVSTIAKDDVPVIP
jgi:amidase